MEIAKTVFELYQAVVPIEWLLGESVDLGDMDKVIESVQGQQQQNAKDAQQMEALQTTGAIQDLAQKQVAMNNPGEKSETQSAKKTGS